MLERTQQHEATQEANGAVDLAKDQARREQQREARIDFAEDGSIQGYNFDGLWRLATMYARAKMVPDQFRGNIEDCAIAIQMAQRCKVDILSYLQNCYIVHGRPGIESKFAIAMLNSSGKITGTIQYDSSGKGDARRCRAYVVDAASGQKVYGPEITWAMVTAEGWNAKKKTQLSKWETMPELMFNYRAAAFLIRTRYPEVILGIQTREELEDVQAAEAAMAEQPAAIQIPTEDTTKTIDKPVEVRKSTTPQVDDSKFMIKRKGIQIPDAEPFTEALLATDDEPEVPEMMEAKGDKWQSLAAKLATCADATTVSAMSKALMDETCENEEEFDIFHEVVDARLMKLEN